MANEFKIKKGLIVDGTGTVLEVIAGDKTLLSVNDATDGSLFAVPNADGFAILSVSGSSIEMGIVTDQGTRPLTVAGGKVYLTGSAYLTNLTITGSLTQGPTATTLGEYSHAQGANATATGNYSHAQGSIVEARGISSHAEGVGNIARGLYSHAEGSSTETIGAASHAEGGSTITQGAYSHAEGLQTLATGDYSHAEGYNTIASADYQHVIGQFNAISTHTSSFVVGNGTADDDRRNLIHAYGTGAGGVVEIDGELRVTGITIGASTRTTPISSSNTTSIHTLSNIDAGKIILFRNKCTASLPTGLSTNFECIIASVSGSSVRFETGSGITFLNNTEMTLPGRLSVTLKKIQDTDEYLTNGGL